MLNKNRTYQVRQYETKSRAKVFLQTQYKGEKSLISFSHGTPFRMGDQVEEVISPITKEDVKGAVQEAISPLVREMRSSEAAATAAATASTSAQESHH